MERFKVDGTTLLSWTIQVQAHDEKEAREGAQHIAGWIDLPSGLATFHRSEHRMAVVHLTDPENGCSPASRGSQSSARTGE